MPSADTSDATPIDATITLGRNSRNVRARFGVYNHFIDVTNVVRHYAFPAGKMDVSNKTFGYDPFKGERKQLHVVFHTPNGRYERDYDEGDTIRFAGQPD